MPKTYTFNYNVQRTEPYNGGRGVAYGPGCTIKRGEIVDTLAGALIELANISRDLPAPHAAFLTIPNGQRAPAGFRLSERVIYKDRDEIHAD